MPDTSLVTTNSLTDDLPVCNLTGIGMQTNQIYLKNGYRQEGHPFQDKSFHLYLEDKNAYFYGIFDGHHGNQAASFAAQHLVSEIYFGSPLNDEMTDDEIKRLLVQSYDAVEKEYFAEAIACKIAEKTTLELRIQGMASYEAASKYPEIVQQLNKISSDVSDGTTAITCLIHNNKIYIANVGDSRAILCRKDSSGNYIAQQLSTDHDLKNENELRRLAQLGLDIGTLKSMNEIGNQTNTRCIGNYLIKGGHKDYEYLAKATGDPVVAEPDVVGGIPIDDSCMFLAMFSDGVYHALEEATGTHRVNSDIIQLIVEEFTKPTQSTLSGVAQGVINQISRIHHDQYFASVQDSDPLLRCQSIGDMTLLVRIFKFPFQSSSRSPSLTLRQLSSSSHTPIHVSVTSDDDQTDFVVNSYTRTIMPNENGPLVISTSNLNNVNSNNIDLAQDGQSMNTGATTTTDSSDCEYSVWDSRPNVPLELDENGRLAPYVNFDVFYKQLHEAKIKGIIEDVEAKL